MSLRFILTLCGLALLIGCSTTTPLPNPEPRICDGHLQSLYHQARDRGIADVQEQPLSPFPYLRADRTLWSLLGDLQTESQRREWLEISLELGRQALRSDHANLGSDHPIDSLENCLEQQSQHLIQDASWPERLATIPYPSRYRTELQVIGLYPLTSRLMGLPLQDLHEELKSRFYQGPQLPTRQYQPASPARLPPGQIRQWLTEAYQRSHLGLPVMTPSRQQQLFAHYAPVWEIEQGGDFDLPGAPRWLNDEPGVNPLEVVTYTHSSYTRWNNRWLLQLSYLVWFDQRPPASNWLDIYAGKLDGLYLRITLDERGQPLLLDSIHPCGCYYSVLPLQTSLQLKTEASIGEPPLLLKPAQYQSGQRLRVSISSQDHMLIGADWGRKEADANRYQLQSSDELRRLPWGAGSQNLFSSPKGLVSGTQRAEKILLWPSGIESPGAMRQWGHHAIAFSSERHFDDPDLLQQIFEAAVNRQDGSD
ncbi:hypothetical protein MIB92_12460 [Aestuariirhabdus sp. Z084]|uniref:hypothetical protein n=1 Tax=Aestuariirhabdus haliotis TaxID=2918751 RepID=UPI00201B3F21|nr:hypothetical protein [Aestuariirhabdus haliotis]MCL6416467.1 hypothetical protein [Aestuariirhabdus haliotis]MCL6420457.1 hypothetical protein [Aestuariirhabdus haliotis]